MVIAASHLILMSRGGPQHRYELREMFNALRRIVCARAPWRFAAQRRCIGGDGLPANTTLDIGGLFGGHREDRSARGSRRGGASGSAGKALQSAVRRARRYWRGACADGTRRRDRASGNQAAGGEKRGPFAAAPSGGRAQLRLAQSLPPICQRLRVVPNHWLACPSSLFACASQPSTEGFSHRARVSLGLSPNRRL